MADMLRDTATAAKTGVTVNIDALKSEIRAALINQKVVFLEDLSTR